MARRKPKWNYQDNSDPLAYLSEEQHRDLAATSSFSREELNALFSMFYPFADKVPEEDRVDGWELTADFKKLGTARELCVHPLIERVLLMSNDDKSGRIRFKEFVDAMKHLSVRSTLRQKLEFTFNLFDQNRSGAIQTNELFELLRMMLGRSHADQDLQAIVDAYLKRFPAGLSFDIFCQMFDVSDLNKLCLNL